MRSSKLDSGDDHEMQIKLNGLSSILIYIGKKKVEMAC